MVVPGMSDLFKSIKTLEDHARARRLGDEARMMLLTREEAEVVESFRRFKDQEYE